MGDIVKKIEIIEMIRELSGRTPKKSTPADLTFLDDTLYKIYTLTFEYLEEATHGTDSEG